MMHFAVFVIFPAPFTDICVHSLFQFSFSHEHFDIGFRVWVASERRFLSVESIFIEITDSFTVLRTISNSPVFTYTKFF